jgi:4'-phosphopantetheinyl transferase
VCEIKLYYVSVAPGRSKHDFGSLSRLLLNKALIDSGQRIQELQFNEYGKPFVPGSFFFNISYSNEYVLCAFNNMYEIGVDIEFKRQLNLRSYEYLLDHREKDTVAKMDPDTRDEYIIELWTKKEAVLKNIGIGLKVAPAKISISNNIAHFEGKSYHLKKVDISTHYFSYIAFARPIRDFQTYCCNNDFHL